MADIAASTLRLRAACHSGRRINVVADAAYHGTSLRNLLGHVTLATRLPAGAVLYDLPPPRGRHGPDRAQGHPPGPMPSSCRHRDPVRDGGNLAGAYLACCWRNVWPRWCWSRMWRNW